MAEERRAVSGLAVRGAEANLRRSADLSLRATLDHRPLEDPRSLVRPLSVNFHKAKGGVVSSAAIARVDFPGENACQSALHAEAAAVAVGSLADDGRASNEQAIGVESSKEACSNPRVQKENEGMHTGEPSTRTALSSNGGGGGSRRLDNGACQATAQGHTEDEKGSSGQLLRRVGGSRDVIDSTQPANGLVELRQEILDLEGKILGRLSGMSAPGNGDDLSCSWEMEDTQQDGCDGVRANNDYGEGCDYGRDDDGDGCGDGRSEPRLRAATGLGRTTRIGENILISKARVLPGATTGKVSIRKKRGAPEDLPPLSPGHPPVARHSRPRARAEVAPMSSARSRIPSRSSETRSGGKIKRAKKSSRDAAVAPDAHVSVKAKLLVSPSDYSSGCDVSAAETTGGTVVKTSTSGRKVRGANSTGNTSDGGKFDANMSSSSSSAHPTASSITRRRRCPAVPPTPRSVSLHVASSVSCGGSHIAGGKTSQISADHGYEIGGSSVVKADEPRAGEGESKVTKRQSTPSPARAKMKAAEAAAGAAAGAKGATSESSPARSSPATWRESLVGMAASHAATSTKQMLLADGLRRQSLPCARRVGDGGDDGEAGAWGLSSISDYHGQSGKGGGYDSGKGVHIGAFGGSSSRGTGEWCGRSSENWERDLLDGSGSDVGPSTAK